MQTLKCFHTAIGNMLEENAALKEEVKRLTNQPQSEREEDLIETIRFLLRSIHWSEDRVRAEMTCSEASTVRRNLIDAMGNGSSAYVFIRKDDIHSPTYFNDLIKRAKESTPSSLYKTKIK